MSQKSFVLQFSKNVSKAPMSDTIKTEYPQSDRVGVKPLWRKL
jgi:hypothetical protein